MSSGKSLGAMNPRPTKTLGNNKTLAGQPIAQPSSSEATHVIKPSGTPAPQSSVSKEIPSVHNDDKQYGLTAFINTVHKMVGSFANLNSQVIEQNFKVAMGNGMSVDDRSVPFECADYVISNLGYIIMGIVLDKDFKQAFIDAVLIEVNIDSKDDDAKKTMRENMKVKRETKSLGSVVIGITSFTHEMEVNLFERMTQSFNDLDSFSGEFDAEVKKMTEEDKSEYGFIFSNWMYLIRAFTHNEKFLSYVIAVIEKVKTLVNTK